NASPLAGEGRATAAPLGPTPSHPSLPRPDPRQLAGEGQAGNGWAAARASGRQAPAPSVMPPTPDPASRSAEPPAAAPPPRFARFSDLIGFAGEQRDLQLKAILERDVRLVRFEDGKLEIALEPGASKTLIGDLSRRLAALTGRRWMV